MSALIVFVITLTIQSTIYDVRSTHIVRSNHIFIIRTGLKSRLIWGRSAVTLTVSVAGAAYTCETENLVRVAVYPSRTIYETSHDTCGGTDVWPLIGPKSAKNSWKLDKVDETRCTWPFQTKNRYDGRWRVICRWFVIGFRMYLFSAPKDQVYLVLAKTLYFFFIPLYFPAINNIALRRGASRTACNLFTPLPHCLWPFYYRLAQLSVIGFKNRSATEKSVHLGRNRLAIFEAPSTDSTADACLLRKGSIDVLDRTCMLCPVDLVLWWCRVSGPLFKN